MIARIVSAALHRLGVVGQLRAQWRDDDRSAQERAVAQAQKGGVDGRSVRESLLALGHEQQAAQARTAAAIDQLTRTVETLAGTCARLERRAQDLEGVLVSNRRDAARLAEFTAALESGALARHIAAAIAAAPLTEEPAPMLTIDRLFPDAVYETFLAAIPPAAAFTEKDRTKADYRARRPRAPISDLTAAVWSALDTELIPRAIVPAVAARVAPFIAAYYRELFGEAAGADVAALPLEATDARLMLRRPGYHLDPHLDPKRVLLTVLLYFARPGDSEAHGTAFYRVDGRIDRDHATTYYPKAAGHTCELTQVVPFRPNTAVAFLNSAAHGADLPAALPPGLERYALQFYVGPPIDALRGVLQRLPETQQRTWAQLLE